MRKFYNFLLSIYYEVRCACLKLVAGDNAWEYLLHDALFPFIVLKLGGAKIGKNVRVGRWLTLHESRGSFANLEIGSDVFIGKNVTIDLSEKVLIGDRCALGMNVQIITHSNFGDSVLGSVYQKESLPVKIGNDCVINWGCIVLKGANIEDKVVILPASVVSGQLKTGCTYCGNPARVIPQKENFAK